LNFRQASFKQTIISESNLRKWATYQMKVLAQHADSSGVTQFIIDCSAADAGTAAGAMYYLPANYRLMVSADDWRDQLGALADDRTIMDRVITQDMEMSDKTSPYSSAEVVLDQEDAVLRTPEAYASAILTAARSAA